MGRYRQIDRSWQNDSLVDVGHIYFTIYSFIMHTRSYTSVCIQARLTCGTFLVAV